MKLSCLPVSFFPDLVKGTMTLGEWVQMARSFDLDGFDLGIVLIQNHTPTYLARLSGELSEAGMGIAMITDYPDFTHPDEKQRERELAYLNRDIALAGQLGARYLRVTAGQDHPDVSMKDKISHAVEYLRRAAPFAQQHGVTLVLENHSKPGAWDHFDITYDPEAFVRVVDGIRDTTVTVNFDTANAVACGADPLRLLEQVIDKVETIHAADTARPGEFEPVVVGTGAVPFSSIFARLRRHGFAGWICIEEWSNTGKDGVQHAIENVRNAWEGAG
jgi:sugar phosphate isomerase/epimerase